MDFTCQQLGYDLVVEVKIRILFLQSDIDSVVLQFIYDGQQVFLNRTKLKHFYETEKNKFFKILSNFRQPQKLN